MKTEPSENIKLIHTYLTTLESGKITELAPFFDEHAVQVEYPNKLNPNGGKSDLKTMLQRAEQGKQIIKEQKYEIRSEISQGPYVAVEALWTATIAVPIGSLPAGSKMEAHFAMFFEIKDGRILSQRNYDCFTPW